MLSRKYYRSIAEIIKSNMPINEYAGQVGVYGVATDLGRMMQDDNPNFDYVKFLTACGIKS